MALFAPLSNPVVDLGVPFSRRMCVVVLKADRLCAEMITNVVMRILPLAMVVTFHRLSEFSAFGVEQSIDLLVTGLGLEDGDLLQNIKGMGGLLRIARRVLVVTTRRDAGLVSRVARLGVAGLFDPSTEGSIDLERAIRAVMAGSSYWSQSTAGVVASRVRHRATVQSLTGGEIRVLKVIGGGCDDKEAAGTLNMKVSAVHSVRRSIYRKLGIHHRAELVRYTVQHRLVELPVLVGS